MGLQGSPSQTDQTVKCTNCGANMQFDPASDTWNCIYCQNRMNVRHQSQTSTKAANTPGSMAGPYQGMNFVCCSACGAITAASASIPQQFCLLCGSPQLAPIEPPSSPSIPNYAIPFRVSREQAVTAIQQWIARARGVPGKLKKEYRLSKPVGVYLPKWCYTFNTENSFSLEIGNQYREEVVEWVEQSGSRERRTREIIKTIWQPFHSSFPLSFVNNSVHAVRDAQKSIFSGLDYDWSEMTYPRPEYISNCISAIANIDADSGFQALQENVNLYIQREVEKRVDSDQIRSLNISTRWSDVKASLIASPAWVTTFLYNGKAYAVAVNGQSGKVVGNAPKSLPRRIWSIFWKVSAGLAVLWFIYQVILANGK